LTEEERERHQKQASVALRRAWSGKVMNRERNSSPGVGHLLRQSEPRLAEPAIDEAAQRPKRQPREVVAPHTLSFAVEGLLKGRDYASESPALQTVGGASASQTAEAPAKGPAVAAAGFQSPDAPARDVQSRVARRCSPLCGGEGDRLQRSEGVRVALAEPPPVLPMEPSQVITPWDQEDCKLQGPAEAKSDGASSPAKQRTAKTAMQVLDLRARSEGLRLRDLDLQANFLGSGVATGLHGKMPVVHDAWVESRSLVVRECRDKLAGAVAALMDGAAFANMGAAGGRVASPRRRVSSPTKAGAGELLALKPPASPAKRFTSDARVASPRKQASTLVQFEAVDTKVAM